MKPNGPIMPYKPTSGPVLLIATIIVGSFIYALYAEYQSRPRTWIVVGCSVVKDDRIREGESVRLKLSGPTFIEVEEFASECVIPIGTEFTDYRVGGHIWATAELSNVYRADRLIAFASCLKRSGDAILRPTAPSPQWRSYKPTR
jgi:hypothetical protein